MRRALAAIGGLLMLAAVTVNLLQMNRLAGTDEVKTAAPLAHVTQTIEIAEPVAEEANEPERDMSAWETAAERDMSAWETAAEYNSSYADYIKDYCEYAASK